MLKINLKSAIGFTSDQRVKLDTCLKLIQLAVNTQEFKDAVLNFEYTPVYTSGWGWWKKTVYGKKVKSFYFAYGEKIWTNQEVYDHVMSGWEEGERSKDGEMDLLLQLKYSKWSSATAYGYAEDDLITIYTWWFNSADVPELCNTIFHEWLHNQTFEHEFKQTVCRDESAPYGLGSILEHIIRRNLAEGNFRA